MNTLPLPGCAPTPLAHYLKALGILRLVAEQADPTATGFWSRDTFHLRTTLDRTALLDFFLYRYEPTPILAPWNGGSGFYPKDNTEASEALRHSTHDRLRLLRESLAAASGLLQALGLKEKPSPEQKPELLLLCRNRLPEPALAWLDAAYVLTQEGPAYPPLLGTGGNDGRLDFTNNFQQRLLDIIDAGTGAPTARATSWLALALFGENCDGLDDRAIGQFAPAATGGANSANGPDAPANINPWDFVLMLEGAALYASAAVKRLETADPGQLSYPFCVRHTAAGYASDSASDEADARCELWLPLWCAAATAAEIRTLLGEGRATVGSRPARDGFDFARAVVSLGVDRGIDSFQRYGFFLRNGLAYFATPLDRVLVRRDTEASDLLTDLDASGWLSAFRRAARGDRAPSRVTAACRALERALFALCTRQQAGDDALAPIRMVFLALGACEEAVASSARWREKHNESNGYARLRPLRLRDPSWLRAMSGMAPVETALAVSLASLPHPLFRTHLEAVDAGGYQWDDQSNEVVWQPGPARLVASLAAIFLRRLILAEKSSGPVDLLIGTVPAPLTAVAAFAEERTDDALLTRLLWSAACCDLGILPAGAPEHAPDGTEAQPPALFALLRLALAGTLSDGTLVPRLPEIVRRAAAGDGTTAARLAARRLRTSGARLGVREIPTAAEGRCVARLAAALVFPLSPTDLSRLFDQLQPVALTR